MIERLLVAELFLRMRETHLFPLMLNMKYINAVSKVLLSECDCSFVQALSMGGKLVSEFIGGTPSPLNFLLAGRFISRVREQREGREN